MLDYCLSLLLEKAAGRGSLRIVFSQQLTS